ncbi:uncharacterized protein LOC133201995 [Saccostrea echinata]|uniref:uncharacterized protein LOC133201995 n=1 Tax=Saccostrea echinata TaxID=191078 RepID=UPI002A813F50|nr:uncharacterized protein LOC133201995 [Saccostrea echinata]
MLLYKFLSRVFLFVVPFYSVESVFKHEVKPDCAASEKECSFDFHVNYITSMVSYNLSTGEGYPVFIRNGTFFKKCSSDVVSIARPFAEIPLTYEEMEDVVTADGNYKFMYSINKQFPAPTIVVDENQKVKVRIHNDLVNEAVTFHWHGMFQKETPWMDGVSMLTQCPILPGQTFTYEFIASPRGTHWYHSHHGAMRTSGLAGALIVLPRQKTERYDIPKVANDVVLMVQEWNSKMSDAQLVNIQKWYMLSFSQNLDTDNCVTTKRNYDGTISTLAEPYNNALVNGKTRYFSEQYSERQRLLPLEVFNISSNTYNRFRLINSGMTGSFRISIDSHKLLLIASDGVDLVPVEIDFLIINPGETYDVILYANSIAGNYWIRVETTVVMDVHFNPIQQNVSFAQLHYKEADDELPKSEERKCSVIEPCVMANCQWSPDSMARIEPSVKCLSIADLKASSISRMLNPVSIPDSPDDFQEIFLNFHFTGNGVKRARPAVNAIHYKSPPTPLLISPDIVKDKSIVCNNEHMENCGEYCQCTHVVKLETKKTTQLVLIAENGLQTGTSHPVHLHGNRFQVLKIGHAVLNKTTGFVQDANQDIQFSQNFSKAKWRDSTWRNGNVPDLKIENPPLKDTVVVPNRGYVVVRLQTDNPGFWLLHCHLETHMNIGMAVVLQVGELYEMPELPSHFPKCSNFHLDSVSLPLSNSIKPDGTL